MTKETKERTVIWVTKDVHKDLMLFKIQSNAKNLSKVIETLIERLKGELNPSKEGDASNTNKHKEVST